MGMKHQSWDQGPMMSFHPEVGGCERPTWEGQIWGLQKRLFVPIKKKKKFLYLKFNLILKHLIISML